MSALDPRVYVACLACYNAGRLHGHWLDADENLPEAACHAFATRVGSVIAGNPTPACEVCGGEEFVVHDHEDFGVYNPGECSVSEAADIGQALRDADHNGEMLTALADHLGQAPQDISCPEDYYGDEAESLAAWAEDFAESCGDLPTGALRCRCFWVHRCRRRECPAAHRVLEAARALTS